MSSEIVKLINELNITSTELSDALNKTGNLPNIIPISDKYKKVGLVYPLFCANSSNYELHMQLEKVPQNAVCVIFTHNCNKIALMGYQNCSYLFNQRGISALLVDGYLRDKDELIKSDFPIWTTGYTPIGCSNLPANQFPEEIKNEINNKFLNSPAICDSTGVVLISSFELKNLNKIKKNIRDIFHKEKVWEYCIKVLGWNTYKTICEQAYLKDRDNLKIDQLDENIKLSFKEVRNFKQYS